MCGSNHDLGDVLTNEHTRLWEVVCLIVMHSFVVVVVVVVGSVRRWRA
jgi:hypothetical protein